MYSLKGARVSNVRPKLFWYEIFYFGMKANEICQETAALNCPGY